MFLLFFPYNFSLLLPRLSFEMKEKKLYEKSVKMFNDTMFFSEVYIAS